MSDVYTNGGTTTSRDSISEILWRDQDLVVLSVSLGSMKYYRTLLSDGDADAIFAFVSHVFKCAAMKRLGKNWWRAQNLAISTATFCFISGNTSIV